MSPMHLLMPGRSHRGPLPPLTDLERGVREHVRRHVEALGGTIGERNLTHRPRQLAQAAEYVERELTDLGYATDEQTYVVHGQHLRNIDANLSGTTLASEIVLVGAHYDTIPGSPGANDNASGVAAMLAIARLLRGKRLARTVRFVGFVNEEPPYFHSELMGSRVYARRCRERGERIVAMLTPETIGCYVDEPGTQAYPLPAPLTIGLPTSGNFIAFVGNVASMGLTRRVIGSFRRHAPIPSEGVAAPESITGVGFSDHWSFWQEGYPAVMVTDTAPFRYPHYHTARDTPDKLDYDRTARVVAGLARVVEDLATYGAGDGAAGTSEGAEDNPDDRA